MSKLTQNVSLTRENIVKTIRDETQSLPYFQCMWEAGAAAFGRVDEWSDIDLQLAVDDDKVADAVSTINQLLEKLGGIESRLVLPEPTPHGHWQAFYQLKGSSPYLLLDLVIMKKGTSRDRFSQPEIHGNAKVYYDKVGFVETEPLNRRDLNEKLRKRAEFISAQFDLFQPFVLKELNRKNYVEAFAYYNGVTLRPLVEILRIKYCPERYDFYTRYVYYDLPRDVAERLEKFYYVSNPDDLERKHHEAGEWFRSIRPIG